MADEPFLARTEEQDKFKQFLDSIMQPAYTQAGKPLVYLLHGEGGMGKTRLTQRLREITEEWQPYQGEFNTLFIDWEVERDNHTDLQVGHDSIHPETVLRVIHDAFAQRGWGKHFQEYHNVIETLNGAEIKINKELQSKPENEAYATLRRIGSKPLATFLRKSVPVIGELIAQDSLEEGIQATAQLGVDILAQARNLVQEKLTPREYEIYQEPHIQLARALGRSIASFVRTKPLVILFDTYEVIDRPECDYTLRQTMMASGTLVMWVVAGRSNLADSVRQGSKYFRGYKSDFPDERIYAKALSEFGVQEIQDYFQHVTPERPLSDEQAIQVARFTLGIPFAVREGVAMWQQGAELEEVVAPLPPQMSNLTPHQRVVNAMSERFLKHCIRDERDLRAVYALALVRRPDHALLCTMLDTNNLSRELQALRERYSFILVDEMRLEEKLNTFLQEYLLPEVRRKDPPVPELAKRAVDFLQKQLARLTSDLSTAEERLDNERVSETMADLTHHKFWLDEDEGWRYLIPHFVEGSYYDSGWSSTLLEIANNFRPTFSEEGKRRLKILMSGLGTGMFSIVADADSRKRMLDEIEKLDRRGWLKGEGEDERTAILLFERGKLLYREERYKDALQQYLEAESHTLENMGQLRAELADSFRDLGFQLSWERGNSIASSEGRTAFEHAIATGAEDKRSHYGLGVMHLEFREYDTAIAEFRRAFELDPKYAAPHNSLGNVYRQQGQYDDAIAEYKRNIELDPKDAFPHNGLGNVYSDQGKCDDAIAAYKRAMELDPKLAPPHIGLGNVYSKQGKYDDAIAAYKRAMELNPKLSSPHNWLGILFYLRGKYDDAIAAYKRAMELNPKFAASHNNLAEIYVRQGRLEDASAELAEAIRLGGENYVRLLNRGLIYAMRGQVGEANGDWQKALTLCKKDDLQDKLAYAFLTLLTGDAANGLTYMMEVIRDSLPGVGVLTVVLKDVEVVAQCPIPPPRIEEMAVLLQIAIKEQSG
ncbi:MAG TPA: tetratricopeptide repeat protein [Chloroflexia bacterium]|nr:tetratricopeptide repeat protein [Chloroflexia bacterium]